MTHPQPTTPASRRAGRRPSSALLAIALGCLVTACGAGGTAAPTGEPGGAGGAGGAEQEAPTQRGADRPAGAASDPLAGLDAKAICARIPMADLEKLTSQKPTRVQAHNTNPGTTCVFTSDAKLTVGTVLISGTDHGPMASGLPKSAVTEPVPEFGASAVVMTILTTSAAGWQVMAEHPNGRIVTAQLNGYADVEPRPSKEATISWYRAVAAKL
jgi:hypothetical protein